MSGSLISGSKQYEAEGATARATGNADPLRQVSVVVPLYNETECLPYLVEQVQGLQVRHPDRFHFEFIFVDDGSTDGTRD